MEDESGISRLNRLLKPPSFLKNERYPKITGRKQHSSLLNLGMKEGQRNNSF